MGTKMTKLTTKELKKMTQAIVTGFNPERIILFGSHAWGKPKKSSDIDLFIIKKTNNRRRTKLKIDSALEFREVPLDLILYTPKQVEKRTKMHDGFLNKIMSKGKMLYEKGN